MVRIINAKALHELHKQNWKEAQILLFENSKKNPCHETFNNLGYYLCSEGLECKNGKVRNADVLGMKYLLKANKIKKTVVNLCAIATAIELKIPYAKNDSFFTPYNAYKFLDEAVKIQYLNEVEYNRLRFLYMHNNKSLEVLDGLEKLVENYKSKESISFYLHVLSSHNLLKESHLLCYNDYIYPLDSLFLYYSCKQYKKCIDLIENMKTEFAFEKLQNAIAIESFIELSQFKNAKSYAKFIQDMEPEYQKGDKELRKIFEDLEKTSPIRQNIILNYNYYPAYIMPCCYFGCKLHNTIDILDC